MMYDPLHDSCPGPQQPPAPSYWQDHSHTSWPATAGPLPNYADVVIIGGGYTGLNAALELAERYQQQVVVLEANQLGWGCSSRNAGFAMPGTGRLGYATWAKRFGETRYYSPLALPVRPTRPAPNYAAILRCNTGIPIRSNSIISPRQRAPFAAPK